MSKIIISVGTSLLQNLLSYDSLVEIFPKSRGKENFIRNLQREMKKNSQDVKTKIIEKLLTTEWKTINNSTDPQLHVFNNFTSATNNLLSFYKDNFVQFINNRKKQAPDFLPAEVSSLYLYYYNVEDDNHTIRDENNNDQIILLCTDTVDSVFCAKVIKEIILRCGKFDFCEFEEIELNDDQFYFKNGIAMIKSLDVYNQENWRDGLSNLFCFVQHENENDEDKIYIRTGGYKELSSMIALILASSEFQHESYYLFEDSIQMLKITAQDTGFDFLTYLEGVNWNR